MSQGWEPAAWGRELLSYVALVLWGHDMKSILSLPERSETRWQSLQEGRHPGPPAERLSQVSLLSVETVGKAARGWIKLAFSCTESVKQSETQGKSFFRSPTEFALTLPHLVWGRQESGYYEHFLFIKLELQELICLLGKLAEYKAASCLLARPVCAGAHPACQARAALPALWRWQRHCLGWWAKQDLDFPGPVQELFFETQQPFAFALLSSVSPEFCWHWRGSQGSMVCFITEVLLLLSKGKPWDDPSWRSKAPCRAASVRACTYHSGQTPAAKPAFTGEANFRLTQPFKTQMAVTLRPKSLAAPWRKSKGKFTKGPYVAESF